MSTLFHSKYLKTVDEAQLDEVSSAKKCISQMGLEMEPYDVSNNGPNGKSLAFNHHVGVLNKGFHLLPDTGKDVQGTTFERPLASYTFQKKVNDYIYKGLQRRHPVSKWHMVVPGPSDTWGKLKHLGDPRECESDMTAEAAKPDRGIRTVVSGMSEKK
ncbi:hypothetical protein E5288_WYG015300 [Bos mutus]|uniref:Uncharacterized protein n=1 Tax=Bos mutus TaxID=72004 RepID=A0A6B0RCZ3_9CETA|nr:hypothetical protein [Bos mutus]